MSSLVDIKVTVVVPNWNGEQYLTECINSLINQTLKPSITIVENGSRDGSLELIKTKYPELGLVINKTNLGFAGGVNSGIRKAINEGTQFVALLNNDAVADKDWLKCLVLQIVADEKVGITTCKFIDIDGKRIDSTGDFYSVWGLPFPRSRGEKVDDSKNLSTDIFAASGGASLYRVSMLNQIGLFDEDFFAYYEDVDISFRAQLSGWKVKYVSESIAYHRIGATSTKIKGFTTYQTMKNLPWLLLKNVPGSQLWKVLPRFNVAYLSFYLSAIRRHQSWFATKGIFVSVFLLPKKLLQRRRIQRNKQVTSAYIWGIIYHDLPPNALKLRRLRTGWERIFGNSNNN
ncbi:MAG TPA: glycosyltransferase family 2 protein [Candidatus Saccharimonadales bacterium]|nr:glycosyltransferase family 2 protein [Candidatus Saccharimonadales bacterium]